MSDAGTASRSGDALSWHEAERWLPAAAAVCWIAFGPNGPPGPYYHEWGLPPDPTHVEALVARIAKRRWRPTGPLPLPARQYRANVRKLMREHGLSAEGLLAHTNAMATWDAARRAAVPRAEDALTAAARAGTLPAIGVRVATPDGVSASPRYEALPAAVLAPPGRVIRLFGDLDWRTDQPGGPEAETGPYYVDIRVNPERMRALWPLPPLEPAKLRGVHQWHPSSASHVSPWEAVHWRAFGSFRPPNVGSMDPLPPVMWQRLRKLRYPGETPADHALRVGQIAARDLAERELKGLLVAGRVTVDGRPAAKDAAGKLLNMPAGVHDAIPGKVFFRDDLSFGIAGTVAPRWTPDARNRSPAAYGGRGDPSPDGVGGFNPLFFDVLIPVADLLAVWGPEAALPPASTEPDVPETKGKGGRPFAHDWAAFDREVEAWVAKNTLEPPNVRRPQLQKHMVGWCHDEWGDDAPHESTVRGRLAPLFKGATRET